MIAAPWVCRSCARSLRRAVVPQLVRRYSAGSYPLPGSQWLDLATYTVFLATVAATSATLPPVLLQRAQKLADEHGKLASELATATSYDEKSAKRIGEIARVAAALKEFERAKD